MDKIKNDCITQCSKHIHVQIMEADSDHSDIPELYEHQVKPGKLIVMIGYIVKIINDCNSNKEICGKTE
eukprot:5050818-Heterocapsa_arctica.AAC.1